MARKSKKIETAAVETIAMNLGETVPSTAEAQIIEEAVQALEAIEEVHATEAPVEPVDLDQQPMSLIDMMANLDQAEVMAKAKAIGAACDKRLAFEKAKHGDGANIEKAINRGRAMMTKDLNAARIMLAAQVDPDVINRSVHEGACYNVYAIAKLADLVNGLATGVITNAINKACMQSLFKFRAAGLTFSLESAKLAASDKIRVADKAIKDALVRHTVSASTAPTQASSTMQALETVGIVRREGSSRNPTFVLTDTPQTARLEEVLKAA